MASGAGDDCWLGSLSRYSGRGIIHRRDAEIAEKTSDGMSLHTTFALLMKSQVAQLTIFEVLQSSLRSLRLCGES